MNLDILTPQRVVASGWYWWREHAQDRWRMEYFDVVHRKHQIFVMGGQFAGPVKPEHYGLDGLEQSGWPHPDGFAGGLMGEV